MATNAARRWWLAPGPIAFAVIIVGASTGVLLEDKLVPPKPIDPLTHVPMPGGATFCDPVPLPPIAGTPIDPGKGKP